MAFPMERFETPDQRADLPAIKALSRRDLEDAIRKGIEDFKHSWPASVPLALVFVFFGNLILGAATSSRVLSLIFPLVSGFALIGPAAAVFFYQMSRLREKGERIGLANLTRIGWRPFWQIGCLTLMLFAIYMMWLMMASAVYGWSVDGDLAMTENAFWLQVLETSAGIKMALVGCGVGFLFASLIFCASVVSFPMLLEHDVGAPVAMGLSAKAALNSPMVMAQWAALIAITLFLASLPMLMGLAVAFPILGHATWHVYRKVVA